MIKKLINNYRARKKDRSVEGLVLGGTFSGHKLWIYATVDNMHRERVNGFLINYKSRMEFGVSNEDAIDYCDTIINQANQGNHASVGALALALKSNLTARTSEKNLLYLSDWCVLIDNEPIHSNGSHREKKLALMRKDSNAQFFFLQNSLLLLKTLNVSTRKLEDELKIIKELSKIEQTIESTFKLTLPKK